MSASHRLSDELEVLVLGAQSATGHAERSRLEGEVISHGRPMTRGLAQRYAHRGAELEDLRAVADAALLGAARRFDVERGHFAGYATITILGEIKRHFRDACWTIRPPRSIQELYPQIAEVSSALSQRGVDPSPAAIAEQLDVPVVDVEQAVAAQSCFLPASLDEKATHGAGRAGAGRQDLGFEEADDRLLTDGMCSTLTAADRELLRLRFAADLTQQEIATSLGRSQMQVSRDLRRILAQLRAETGATAQVDLLTA